MENYFYKTIILSFLMFAFTSNSANAQCTDFLEGPFTNLDDFFGGAPCDDGSGCVLNEFTYFEVFASEAYVMGSVIAGGEYAFSICNGPGAGTWVPDFTIVAPSGAVDAFGAGDGDGCTITWTASESGQYTIIINEEKNCGGGANTGTGNGFPAITCVSGAICATACNAGTLESTDPVDVCTADDTFDFFVLNDTVPTGGGYGFSVDPLTGASGGVPTGFVINGIETDLSWNSDLNGILSFNNLGLLSGSWVFRGFVTDAAGDACDISVDSLIVTFTTGETCGPVDNTCNAGSLTTGGVVSLCDSAETFEFGVENDTIPTNGDFGYAASPLNGGTGGLAAGFNITGVTNGDSWDSDLNGILSSNNLEALSGPWSFRGFVRDASQVVCGVTADSLIVFFGTESPVVDSISWNGFDEITANVTGGVSPYTYLWDDAAAQTTQTAVGLESGTYTVFVTDAYGCIASEEITFTISSTNRISTLNDYSIAPNPSTGNFIVNLELEQNSLIQVDILDITGRLVETASQQTSNATFDFALQNANAGMYFVRINVGQETMTQKIIVTK